MKGGAYSSGNAYPAECYKAPGSSMPVYEASTAGFSFSPSTIARPDGVPAFMEVNPVSARVGGGRRSRKYRRGMSACVSRRRKHRRNVGVSVCSRKGRKVSRRSRKAH